MTQDIEFTAESAKVSPSGSREVFVEIEEADVRELLEDISLEDIISTIGSDEILEEIGKETAIKYFNIKEAEEE